mmetsp:Transcript_46720/g.119222  ORF Transcript_46720/g.119222 Transcript_46720/m.119222 type:complete len:244 (+) Transcript_46720:227-958(+)|eukprot:jgi/Tetstr1/446742/TSEL_034229.t1
MADFNLRVDPAAGGGGGVEWYDGGATGGGGVGYGGGGVYSGGYSPGGKMSGGGVGGYGSFGGDAAQFGSFDDEPPLLEELGIDIGAIVQKVRGVLLFRMRSDTMADLDLGGPLLFVLLLSSLHLLTGRLHFGVILGWSVLGSGAIWWVTSLLSGIDSSTRIDLYNTCCLLGYGMLPLCLFAALAVVVPRGPALLGLAAVMVLWCTAAASKMFVIHAPSLMDTRILVAYPCLLFYSLLAMLSFY